ncbi:NAD-dependent epimerase/dehydratase family protein [Flavobacterium soyangense]|uniref:NAD-dependent epimerase/dehydratase family protein n=1 Tax=Flavobacterium soyangense TaxID=2023265 RepID=A0A930XVE1_9FLAO|nr:NAD-dependent epimerase/dehydratase family protein [Flavobacterium soyangense]MBF2708211.1 NAD-dependent epimerase/dehydratase family protein [Flavobacterium soyangense]
MEILLTGANGFLGKSIVKELASSYNLISLSRTSGDYKVSLEKEIPEFFQKFDLVIHSAGKAHSVPKTDIEKQSFFEVNVKGTENLLKGLENAGLPKQFVFISSVSVYGVISGNQINEEQPLMAIDPYGKSKILAEKLVQDWCAKNNIICTILRLPLVVGKNPPGNLGAMINGIRKGFYFNIAGGNAKKSMVLADDISRVLLKVAEVGGIYNLTDGYHPNFYEISLLISKQLGKGKVNNMPIWIAEIFAFFGDIIGSRFPINSDKLNKLNATLTFDDLKARRAFGWNPQAVLKEFKIN